MGDFDGHKLQALTKEGLKFGDEDEEVLKKRSKMYKETFKPLTKYLKDLLSGKVAKVAVSQRVESSPSVIVTSQYGHTANMERIMRAQTFASAESLKAMAASKTLEINPRHPLIITLNQWVQDNGADDTATQDLAYLVYETAMATSGFTHDDPEGFAQRMVRVLAARMNVNSLELAEEVEIEEEDENVAENDMHEEL